MKKFLLFAALIFCLGCNTAAFLNGYNAGRYGYPIPPNSEPAFQPVVPPQSHHRQPVTTYGTVTPSGKMYMYNGTSY